MVVGILGWVVGIPALVAGAVLMHRHDRRRGVGLPPVDAGYLWSLLGILLLLVGIGGVLVGGLLLLA
jgi:hypothetical protein